MDSPALKLGALGVLTVLVFLAYVSLGTRFWYWPDKLFYLLLHPSVSNTDADILWTDRMPRACTCAVIGAILAMVGSAFQALFRNPLAEPYVVGVSSGSAVGGALAVVLGFGASWGGFFSGLGQMIAAFPTGFLSLLLVLGLSKRRGVLDVQTLLLAGVVVGSMLSAVLSVIILGGGLDTRIVLAWLLGSITPAFWNRALILLLVLVAGGSVLIAQSRRLNAFALGEETAQHLGVDVSRLKPAILLTGTAMVAATVGAVGIIGFLGLVAPHIARRMVGVDWRWSMWASGLLGSCVLLVSDSVAQCLIRGAEIPVGIVTAIIGAPVLLVLLRKG